MTLVLCLAEGKLHFGLASLDQFSLIVLKITIAIVMVVFEIPIVTDSDSIGHPWFTFFQIVFWGRCYDG